MKIITIKYTACILLVFLVFSLSPVADAKVYIDITSPTFRKLPISIAYRGAEEAKEVAEIVRNDLDFTGIFYLIDPDVLGAEITIKIDTGAATGGITTDVVVSDLVENREILSKRYTTLKNNLRALAHSLSNDIYNAITGKDGVFRTRLAYIVASTGKKWLYIMDWDGFNPVRIVSNGLTVNQNWSRDSRYIVYSSERNKKWGIYSLNLLTYKEMPLFSSVGLNLVGGLSPDNRIAFSSSKDGNPEIYIMNIAGSNYKKLTTSFGIDVSPVFSPDGSQIAFVSDRGGTPQIYLMDPEGVKVRRLTFEGSYNTSPAWSPDGKWLAFSGRNNGKNQIFMIKSDGIDLMQLTEKGNNENPAFSPDGMFIAFDSDRTGVKGIYLMRINGNGQKRITPVNVKAMNPKWSPYIK